MSPFEHGEVFVLDDGGEVSLAASGLQRLHCGCYLALPAAQAAAGSAKVLNTCQCVFALAGMRKGQLEQLLTDSRWLTLPTCQHWRHVVCAPLLSDTGCGHKQQAQP